MKKLAFRGDGFRHLDPSRIHESENKESEKRAFRGDGFRHLDPSQIHESEQVQSVFEDKRDKIQQQGWRRRTDEATDINGEIWKAKIDFERLL